MEILTAYENYDKYFRYNGKAYGHKTKVRISQKYINYYLNKGQKIFEYAWFSNSIIENEEKKYVFWEYNYGTFDECKECRGHFIICENELEWAIEKIVFEVPVNIIKKEKKKDFEEFNVIVGWIIYIITLLFSFIFTQWYMIWIFASIYFFAWRNKTLWER